MSKPSEIATDTSHRWLTLTEAAEYFGKDRSLIFRWCNNGTCIEAGFRVFRDVTGHWWVGLPVVEEVRIPLQTVTPSLP